MADCRVLIIDTDSQFTDFIRSALLPYGVDVDVVDDGSDGLQRAKEVSPELVFIAVELPDKHGYSICNKAKKGVAKNIPVVLATSSVSPADLEQHRKLKVHADEYIDKRTLTAADFVAKIDSLIGLGPMISDDEMELPLDAEEIAIDEEDLAEEELAMVDEDAGADGRGEPGDEATRISGFVDEGIDAETEAAFAMMSMGGIDLEESFDDDDAPSTAVARLDPEVLDMDLAAVAPPASVEDTDGLELGVQADDPLDELAAEAEALGSADDSSLPIDDEPVVEEELDMPVEVEPALAVAADPSEQLATTAFAALPAVDAGADLDLGLDAVAADAVAAEAVAQSGKRAKARTTNANAHPSAEVTAHLEAEVQRLTRELEEAKKTPAAPTSSPFSREREFLNLREVINRKEKEMIELREELDARDRAVLTSKEKMREAEKHQRETDERLLEVETNLVGANERIAMLTGEKDKGLERERGLKTRLEVAQNEVKKSHEEIEAQKQRAAAEAKAAAEALATEQQAHAGSRDQAARVLADTQSAGAQALADAEARRTSELGDLDKSLRADKEEALTNLRAERDGQAARTSREHEATLAALRDEHAGEITALHGSHEEALGRKDREREVAVQRANEEREAALSAAEQRRVADLTDAEEKRQTDLSAADERRESELAAKESTHKKAVQELEKKQTAELLHAEEEKRDALAAAEKRRQDELATADHRRLTELGTAEKRRQDELSAAEGRHNGEIGALTASFESDRAEATAAHEAAVKALETEISGLQSNLTTARGKISELEGELATARSTIIARDKAIEGYQRDIAARDGNISDLRAQVTEMEHQSAELQDQLLKAYQKIKNDEQVVAKAKKAMAVALTLLDEQHGNDESTAS